MKRAQFAVESLFVHSFAALLVLGSFSAFVLIKDNTEASLCSFPPGLDCVDKPSITDNKITLALKNNLGKLTITDIKTDDCSIQHTSIAIGPYGSFSALPATVSNDQIIKVKISCLNLEQLFKGSIRIDYVKADSGLLNHALGEVRGSAS